ncbi:MarR family transcriptional regulator [Cytobacillus sp. FSL W7-1323]|uniref:MarR family winged helix-turn-helix transcriptional regulator n=1 Tax=Cytobacillus TaxID=2675230 RepID=UPI00203FFDAE|nr:MarR family transcriptional regulator [Cytobacillus kochii]MCM3323768.1 MarR family transcriptional regulator [Cytobacillus kochii]MCM3346051.1 MarR family transcriptional regulator [Cytobacillus kochii]
MITILNEVNIIIASQRFFHHFMMLYRPFENRLNSLLTKHQLQRAQWTILYYLYHFGPTTLVEIAAYQGVEKPTVTRTINQLEEYGYVEKIPSMDKREKKMKITNEGEHIYKKIRIPIDQFEMEILEGITPEEQEECIRIFDSIKSNL